MLGYETEGNNPCPYGVYSLDQGWEVEDTMHVSEFQQASKVVGRVAGKNNIKVTGVQGPPGRRQTTVQRG